MKQSEVRIGSYCMLTVRGRAVRVAVRYQRTPERAGDVRYAVVDDNGDYHVATPRQLRPVSSGPASLYTQPGAPGQRIELDDVVIETTLHRIA